MNDRIKNLEEAHKPLEGLSGYLFDTFSRESLQRSRDSKLDQWRNASLISDGCTILQMLSENVKEFLVCEGYIWGYCCKIT
jgi:hypothetical protein